MKSKKITGPSKKLEKATFAGGCFWCIQPAFVVMPGVISVIAGYAGGEEKDPRYEDVAIGLTGHREAIQIFYDADIISYNDLLDFFWKQIDPTDNKGQFVDRGNQYSPAIFYHTKKQKKLALASKKELEKSRKFDKLIVTEILPYESFYPAEEYHQDYHKKNPIKYRLYRIGSGRDQFLKKIWGDEYKDNFEKYEIKNFNSSFSEKTSEIEKTKFSKKNFDAISLGIKIPNTFKIKDFEDFGNVNHSKFSKNIFHHGKEKRFTKPKDSVLKKILTPIQYEVTQKNGTEPPFNNEYWDSKDEGIYVDIVSGEPLFSSKDKFDSGTGWPSFTKPLEEDNIVEKEDRSLFMKRTEVRSKHTDNHLGHVFNDGPNGSSRYCMNSAALRFIPKEELEREGYSKYREF